MCIEENEMMLSVYIERIGQVVTHVLETLVVGHNGAKQGVLERKIDFSKGSFCQIAHDNILGITRNDAVDEVAPQ